MGLNSTSISLKRNLISEYKEVLLTNKNEKIVATKILIKFYFPFLDTKLGLLFGQIIYF